MGVVRGNKWEWPRAVGVDKGNKWVWSRLTAHIEKMWIACR